MEKPVFPVRVGEKDRSFSASLFRTAVRIAAAALAVPAIAAVAYILFR
jgi:hypothetical protein